MLIAENWKDYELIDAGFGDKLERWGDIILKRPDPQAVWPGIKGKNYWKNIHAYYTRSSSGGGRWKTVLKVPERWSIGYKDLKFYVSLMGFKHTGIFPEQAVNWDWISKLIKERSGRQNVRVLNLFAYTGGATIAAANAGAEVCHVDAARGIIQKAKENLELSGLKEKPVRFINDDVIKFVKREIRRGKKYEAVIMDPPAYGRGPKGEMWKLEKDLYGLVNETAELMSDNPLFMLINSYASGIDTVCLENILRMTILKKHPGNIMADSLGLKISKSDIILPCGSAGRWCFNGN